eukprot:TRINITY_DN24848_c0_g1_i1.p1 TRINITY_DN24848_c0_g1~~TRINITY_DN24848_c0_g1_i1.p1  ORF type:complete len:361 (+),score=45.10 TRINITY_DN24848_c0_g1_i1:85-1167(+)
MMFSVCDMRKPNLPGWKLEQCNKNLMTRRRAFHCAVLWEGKMFLWGGLSQGGDNEVAVYDCKEQMWTNIPTNPTPRALSTTSILNTHIATAYKGYMYLFGRFGVCRLHLASMQWEDIDPVDPNHQPPARYAHCGASSDQFWYVFGGLNDDQWHLDDLWKFDLENRVWTEIEQECVGFNLRMETTLMHNAMEVVKDTIFLLGFKRGLTMVKSKIFRDTVRWELEEMPYTRTGMALAASDRRLFMFGGYEATGHDSWHRYSIEGNVWVRLQPNGFCPSQRSGHTLLHDPTSSLLYLFGGSNSTGSLNDLYTISSKAMTALLSTTPSPTVQNMEVEEVAYSSQNTLLSKRRSGFGVRKPTRLK